MTPQTFVITQKRPIEMIGYAQPFDCEGWDLVGGQLCLIVWRTNECKVIKGSISLVALDEFRLTEIIGE